VMSVNNVMSANVSMAVMIAGLFLLLEIILSLSHVRILQERLEAWDTMAILLL